MHLSLRVEQGRAQKGGIQAGTGLPATLKGDETCAVRMPPCRLTILLRAPRPGTVKSRLAAVLGDDAALAAYRELLERTLRAVSALAPVELRCTPDDAIPEIRALASPSWQVSPQGNGDLGERIHRAFADGFRDGVSRMVVIGTDCPQVTADDVQSAWNALGTAEVVLGPASDGGYWLIGLRAPQPRLFLGIDWGGPEVLNQTRRNAAAAGLRLHQLRELSDVDTAEDWIRYRMGSL